ncbi:MAG: T9SS type A sorting domain-containing protein [Cyclobacteriaceae bacterium]
MRILLSILFLVSSLARVFAQPEWSVNPNDYQYSMTVIADLSIDEAYLQSSQDMIGAFVDGELRGVANPQIYIPSLDRKVAFLTIFSNSVSGETIRFQLYHSSQDDEVPAINELAFVDGGQEGQNADPYLVENLVLKLDPSSPEDVHAFSAPFTISLSSNLIEEVTLSLSVVSGPVSVERIDDTNQFMVSNDGVAGVATLDAIAPGSGYYDAVSKTIEFEVLKLDQTIDFGDLDDKTFGDAPFTLAASSSSDLPVNFEVIEGPISITDETVTITGAGVAEIRATQTGDESFNPALSVTQSFTIHKASQTITFTPASIPAMQIDDADFSLSVANTSGEDIALTVTGPATATEKESNVFTISLTGGTGEVTLTATAAESANYLSTTESMSFEVLEPSDKQNQTISFDEVLDKTYGDEPFQLNAVSTSGLDVLFYVVQGPVSIEGNTVSIEGVGEVVVGAVQEGNDEYSPAEEVQRSFSVDKASQQIDFTFDHELNENSTAVQLVATASSGLPVTFSSSNQLVFSIQEGNVLQVNSAGEAVLTARQDGDAFYHAASVHLSVVVSAVLNRMVLKESVVYPNPAIDYISFDLPNGTWEYRVYNSQGQSISAGVAQKNLAVEKWNEGVYLIEFRNTGDYVHRERIVKISQ